MNFHFDAVFYYVSDMERAVAFYRDVLGFRLASCDVVARFDLDGVLFEIVPTHDRSQLAGSGNARLCLRVDDVEKACAHLKSRGVLCTDAQSKPNGRLASFPDPDGNEVCLWQYCNGSGQTTA